ncbi:ATP-dependent Clp protease adapter ClpS [bacterium]|nr:ATP-dependent Clp protease adapter ClpS [bacterium]
MPNKHESQTEGEAQVATKERVKVPKMYQVILLNDDFTPMDFVVWILESVFHKTKDEAIRVMLEVHQKGKGICGVYTHDMARTKMMHVNHLAKKSEHPLQCIMEPAP